METEKNGIALKWDDQKNPCRYNNSYAETWIPKRSQLCFFKYRNKLGMVVYVHL